MKEKGLRLPKQVIILVEELLRKQGINFSEYARALIVADLDRRSVFTTQLKNELFGIEEVTTS